MRGGRILLIVGLVLIVGALVFGIYQLVKPSPSPPPTEISEEETPVPKPPETLKPIVVAAQNIPRGMAIEKDANAVVVQNWPTELVPEGAISDPEAVYGLIIRVEVVRGMPILEGMLTDKGSDLGGIGSDAALQIPPGKVAYALPVARWSSVAWALQPGDHVDVLISLLVLDIDEEFQTILPSKKLICMGLEGEAMTGCTEVPPGRIEMLPSGAIVIEGPNGTQRPRMVTQLTVQDAVVLHVGDWLYPEEEMVEEAPPSEEEGEAAEGTEEQAAPTPRPEIESLTLIVTPQDAVVLKYAEEMGASMDLVLRSFEDANRLFTTESVTLEYLFDRFTIELPPKLPYGITPPTEVLREGTTGER